MAPNKPDPQDEINELLESSYNCKMDINPKDYSIDAATLKTFVNNEGAILSRTKRRSVNYFIFYNEPIEIANIGFAIGNLWKSKQP